MLPQNRSSDNSVRISALLIAGQFQLFYRWADIANLATTLVRALEGQAAQWPERMPISPFLDQEAELQREMVSLKQAREYVGLETGVASSVAENEARENSNAKPQTNPMSQVKRKLKTKKMPSSKSVRTKPEPRR